MLQKEPEGSVRKEVILRLLQKPVCRPLRIRHMLGDITHGEKLDREEPRGELGASEGSEVALFQNNHLICFKK